MHSINNYKIFNLLLVYEYVPTAFGKGLTFPIPKSYTSKYEDSSSNYRGITVNPIFSKIFEHCLLSKFGKYLATSEFQFGFKSNSSCSHAHYALQSTMDYFIERGSTINICSIDMSKAFDKLNCFILFKKLMARKCPFKFITILHIMFSISCSIIKWGDCLSKVVFPNTGVRQGSILSPILFSVYVNDLLNCLRNSKLGCHLKYIPFNAFMYADDLLIMSITVFDLQEMLSICENEFLKIDMCVNVSKSSCIRLGPRFNACVSNVVMARQVLKWNDELKYLGMTILAGKMVRHDFHPVKAKFFGALNNILGKVGTSTSLSVLLHLMYTKCSPVLTYGLEAVKLNKKSRDNLHYVHNSIFSKLFMSFDKSTLEQCHYYTGYLTFDYAMDLKRLNFLRSLSESQHSPANYCFKWFGYEELNMLKIKYNIQPNASSSRWKFIIWDNFRRHVEDCYGIIQ